MISPIPKISIVTPSFNQAMFLEETILSVVDQEYPNLEYVLIDGGSSDFSIDIIKKYAKHLHFWISEKDEGHGHALNKGFSHTSGDIMGWINSDDKYTPWSLKVVAEIFTLYPNINWITGFNSWWNSQGAMTHAARNQKNIYDFLLGRYAWIQQESVFWRRGLWEKAGGSINQEYRFMVDGELWTRFFLHDELYSVDCILGGYRFHSKNRAKDNSEYCLQEMDKAILIMEKSCSENIKNIYSKLNEIINAKKLLSPSNHTETSELIGKRFALSELKCLSYKNIAYIDDRWVERYLPFPINID